MTTTSSVTYRRAARVATVLGAIAASACGAATRSAEPAPPPPPVDTAPPPSVEAPPVIQHAAPQELAFPDEAFRAEQPQPGAPRPFRLPKVQPFTLGNGLKVYLVEQHVLPIVSIDLNFDGGSRLDPPGQDGLASLCMSLVNEGTAQLDKIAYNEALADLASTIATYAAPDSQGVAMHSLSKHLQPTLALLRQVLLTPGMRAPDLDRLIKRRIEAIRQSKGSPSSIANRVSDAVLFGPAHPLGAVETEATVSSVTLETCKAYATRWLRPRGARLFVVGDLTEAQVRQAFEGPELASWTGAAPKVAAPPRPATMAGRIFLVHVPGAAQSQVQALHFGPKRVSPDYFATSMMSAVFGGGFTSRINMNLREDKGYSYGARGGFSYSRDFGTFSAGSSVRTDATYQSLLEIDREFKALWAGRKPISQEELEREKTGAILSLPARFATGNAALGQYRGLVYYGLPLDYYASYIDNLNKVSLRDVSAAAAKHLNPGKAVYLVVGDAEAKMIVRDEHGKDVPLMKDGAQLTLRQALGDLAARGDVGGGGLVVLDSDAKILR
ncbi:MAG: pitrilysin family protein [Kofleriaceae bacterium]